MTPQKEAIYSRRYKNSPLVEGGGWGEIFRKDLVNQGIGSARKIDLPSPQHQEGYDQLRSLVDECAATRDAELLTDLISSIKIDLDWYEEQWEGFNVSQTARQYRRMYDIQQRVFEELAKLDSVERVLDRSTQARALVDIRQLTDRLIAHVIANPDHFHAMHPRRFEEMVAELLFRSGWTVELSPETRDGGYDIFAVRKIEGVALDTTCIVQCKRYAKQRRIGIEIVRELLHVKQELAVGHALIATTSDFSRDVYAYQAHRWDLDLKNRDRLLEWCRRIHVTK